MLKSLHTLGQLGQRDSTQGRLLRGNLARILYCCLRQLRQSWLGSNFFLDMACIPIRLCLQNTVLSTRLTGIISQKLFMLRSKSIHTWKLYSKSEVNWDLLWKRSFSKRATGGYCLETSSVNLHIDTACRDWTMQTSPSPAHPSYRLITALRLYHVLPQVMSSSLTETLLDEWRNTTLGKQDVISEENERLWRGCLMHICEEIMVRAGVNLSKIKKIKEGGSMDWVESVKCFIETLWEEENYVAKEMIKSLQEW